MRVPAYEATAPLEGLREATRGVTLGGVRIKDLVNDGRP